MNQKVQKIEITPPKIVRVDVTIEGISSLLMNRRTEEMIKGKANPKRNEDEIFQEAIYPKQNGNYVIPSVFITRCATNAAHTFATSIPRTRARGAFFIPEPWIVLNCDEPVLRKDGGNNPNKRGVAITIIRPEFKKWKATFPIEYDENGPLSLEQILNLINIAGHYVGIGAWRPQKDGNFGRFKIVGTK